MSKYNETSATISPILVCYKTHLYRRVGGAEHLPELFKVLPCKGVIVQRPFTACVKGFGHLSLEKSLHAPAHVYR